jgi:hypothetical protein
MINDKIKKALEQSVVDANQKPELANKLLSWIENVVDGNESVNDTARYSERCEICFDNVELGENNTDSE